jgi:hypothetical protein
MYLERNIHTCINYVIFEELARTSKFDSDTPHKLGWRMKLGWYNNGQWHAVYMNIDGSLNFVLNTKSF